MFFFFNDTATTEIYTLSLHDALPILLGEVEIDPRIRIGGDTGKPVAALGEDGAGARSEEHTSELQSRQYLVCRLLLEKKKKKDIEELHPQEADLQLACGKLSNASCQA